MAADASEMMEGAARELTLASRADLLSHEIGGGVLRAEDMPLPAVEPRTNLERLLTGDADRRLLPGRENKHRVSAAEQARVLPGSLQYVGQATCMVRLV